MVHETVRGSLALALLLTLGKVALAANQVVQNPPPADPPGTAGLMNAYRAWFDKHDKNHDGVLDKSELAKALRGVNAKPAPEKRDAPKQMAMKTKTRSSKAQPSADAQFLELVDQDKDGSVSREEFLGWARQMAAQTKQVANAQAMQALQQQTLLTQTLSRISPNPIFSMGRPTLSMAGGCCRH